MWCKWPGHRGRRHGGARLPLLNADRVWDRVRGVGLGELMQFDWGLVGESDGLATDLAEVAELDAAAVEGRLCRIRDLVGERRRYLEIQAWPRHRNGPRRSPTPRHRSVPGPGGTRHRPRHR